MKGNTGDILRKTRDGEKLTEKELLTKLKNGKTVLEYVIGKNRPINCDLLQTNKSLNIIFRTKKFDLLKYTTLKALFRTNQMSPNERYIDTLIRLFKNGRKINMTLFDIYEDKNSLYEIADLYLLYAKNDLLSYLYELDDDGLLSKVDRRKKPSEKVLNFLFPPEKKEEITFLEILLEKDAKTTLEKLVSKEAKKNAEVGVLLLMNKINAPIAQLDFMNNKYIEDLEKRSNEEYSQVELDDQLEHALTIVYNAFKNDSDPKALTALLNAYRMALRNNETSALYEMHQLIKIKQNNPEFCIKMGTESFYNSGDNNITLKNAFPTVASHEIGHGLLHNLTDMEIPEEFYEILDRIRKNPQTIKKVKEYTDKMTSVKREVYSQISRIYDEVFPEMNKILEYIQLKNTNKKFFDYSLADREEQLRRETQDVRAAIKKFVETTKEEKKKMLLEKGYNEETIDMILDNSFTITEYVLQHKKIQKREIVRAISSGFLEDDTAIGDFYDAVYRGDYSDDRLVDEDGNVIKGVSGHGTWYYNFRESNVLDEMVANYSLFLKSPNKDECMAKLRYYLGDELVDYLGKYYNENIAYSTKYEKEATHERNR